MAPEDSKNNTIFLALRHPLTTLTIGFIFTILIGGAITRHFDNETKKQRTIEYRIEISEQLIASAAKLLVNTKLLTEAYRRNESQQRILSKISAYEQSKLDWWTKSLLINSYTDKAAVGPLTSETLSSFVKKDVQNAFDAMDECLIPAITENNIAKSNKHLNACKKHSYGYGWSQANHKMEDRIKIVESCISSLYGVFNEVAALDISDEFYVELTNFLRCDPPMPLPDLAPGQKKETNRESTLTEKVRYYFKKMLLESRPPHFAH